AVLFRDPAEKLQITFTRRDAAHVAHHWLHDHAGNLAFELLESFFNSLLVVERQRERELGLLRQNTGRSGNSQSGHAGPSFDEQRIRMPVIAAFKLDDVL